MHPKLRNSRRLNKLLIPVCVNKNRIPLKEMATIQPKKGTRKKKHCSPARIVMLAIICLASLPTRYGTRIYHHPKIELPSHQFPQLKLQF